MEMTETYFTKTRMSEISGVPARTILFYTQQGLLIPEIDNPTEKGKSKKYSKKNITELFIIKALTNIEFRLDQLKKIFKIIDKKKQSNRLDPSYKWGKTIGLEARIWIYRTWDNDFDVYVDNIKHKIKTDLKYITMTCVNLESIFVTVDNL